MGNESNTFPYSMSIFNSLVIAILTFFFPLGSTSRFWSIMVMGLMMCFMDILYFKREELAANKRRTFNQTLALVTSYVIAAATVIMIPLLAWGQKGTNLLELSDSDNQTLIKMADAYVYLLLFMFHLQNTILGMLAGEQGRRVGLIPLMGMVFALACSVLYYINNFEVLGAGVLVPTWAQSIGFLLLIPSLFRLRVLESYGHI